MVKLKVLDWETDNPQAKIEGKFLYWFRFNSNFLENHKLSGLKSEDKFVYVGLLCLAAQQGNSIVSLSLKSLSQKLEIKPNKIIDIINILIIRELIILIYNENSKSQKNTDRTDRYSTDIYLRPKSCQEVCSESSQTEKTDGNPSAPSETEILLIFEQVYSLYPRKEGRSRGLRVFRREVRSQESLNALCQAIENYNLNIKRQKIEKQFIKHFSTFMNEWKDWIDFKPPSETGYQVLGGGAYAE